MVDERRRATSSCGGHRRVLAFAFGLVAGPFLLSGAARAEMKDWQLRRFLNFRSECQMDDFVDKSAPTGPGKFHAICRNTTFYPDGVDLECPDRIDEWTCHILTKPLDFKDLDILKQQEEQDAAPSGPKP